MAVIKETVPFNYDELFAKTRDKFIERGYDTQPGSNTMQLVTAMSYLVSMLNTNTAVNINEMLLTLARKRNNILQDARLLGYEPVNKVSYRYELELTLPGGDFILPKYSEFMSGDKKYYYFGNIITIPNAPAGYKLNIEVKEGELTRSFDNPELSITIENFIENGIERPQYYVDIPFTNVEDDGIEAILTYYDENGILFNKEEWTKIKTFTVDSDTILNKQFYRLNNIDYNTPRIFFKLPNTSDDLRLGTKIELNVLKSSGSSGAITDTPTCDLGCEVSNYKLIVQGTEEETNESIKINAPAFWNSANRAVTKSDYRSICERLTLIHRMQIWDGNKETPKIPGKIWFSFLPETYTRKFKRNAFKTIFELDLLSDEANWFLESFEIESIFEYLDVYKIPTLELIHRQPTFLDFEFNIEILKYDITLSESDQNELIFDIIDKFFSDSINKIEDFETEFFKSNLIKRIDTQVTDITGLNLSMRTFITLYNRNIINEVDLGSKRFSFALGLPYEKYYDEVSGDLIVQMMPNIDTPDFIYGKNLTVDWASLQGNEVFLDLVVVDILLDSDKIGEYKIYKDNQIIIEIFVDDTIITEENINQKILNVEYPTGNIQMSKNTLPRLRKISFK